MAPNGARRNSGQNPWHSGPEEGPPDLTQLFKKFFGKGKKGPGQSSGSHMGSPGQVFGITVLIAVVLWALAGIFVVTPAEESVILRFGKYLRSVGPGPHWIPVLFETRHTANIQRIDSFPYESEMLTQDGNILSVKVQVQYRIANLKEFLFNVVDPISTMHQALSSSLRQVVGQMDMDPILTTGRQELSQRVTDLLNQTLVIYKTGLEIREVTLQSAKPPEAVTAAFDDVIKAKEDETRFINQADAYAKKRVLSAQGEIARIQQEADAYRYSVVAQSSGATARFLALLKPYQEAPRVTRERLYLDTVSQVLKNTNNIMVEGGNNNVLYLPLEQLLARQNQQTPSSATASANTPEATPLPSHTGNSEATTNSNDLQVPETDDQSGQQRPSYPIEVGGSR